MDAGERFLAKYVQPNDAGDLELPPLKDVDPERIRAMDEHFEKLELAEQLGLQTTRGMLFVG